MTKNISVQILFAALISYPIEFAQGHTNQTVESINSHYFQL